MKLRCCMLLIGFYRISNAQHLDQSADVIAVSDNIKKFAEVYGFATQIMNLGGSFINAERTSQSQPNQLLKNNDNDGGTKNYGGTKNELNGIVTIMTDIFKSKSNEPNVGYRQITSNYGNVGAYGGGPLGAASSRSQSRSIIESLMGSFLGSSVDNNGNGFGSQAASSNQFAPAYEEYGANGMSLSNSGGTDIEAIVRTLTRNGAKKADISEQGGAMSFLSQFFSGKK